MSVPILLFSLLPILRCVARSGAAIAESPLPLAGNATPGRYLPLPGDIPGDIPGNKYCQRAALPQELLLGFIVVHP